MKKNAQEILVNVMAAIDELEAIQGHHVWDRRYFRKGYSDKYTFNMHSVCDELSIFDWWNDELSLSQLKQMKKFLEQAISLGFTGYVCFKVGSKGCSHGMWAHKEESTTGYSPEGDALYHSFVSDENYWDVCLNGEWQHGYSTNMKLAQVKEILKNA